MHTVRFVSDEALPEHEFALLELDGQEGAVLFIRGSAVTPRVLEDAWAAYRALSAKPELPRPRRSPPRTYLGMPAEMLIA